MSRSWSRRLVTVYHNNVKVVRVSYASLNKSLRFCLCHLPRSLLPVLSQYYSIWRSRASFCAEGSCLLPCFLSFCYLFFFSIRPPFLSFLSWGLLPFSPLMGSPLLRSAFKSMCLPAPCCLRGGSWPSRRSLLKPPFGCKDLNV